MSPPSQLLASSMQSPVGELVVVSNEKTLRAVLWGDEAKEWKRVSINRLVVEWKSSPAAEQAIGQLTEYFDGKRQNFDLPLEPVGTEFQCTVWNSLTHIKYGSTLSYSEQALALGRPSAVRAVASANGRNPISIVVPCHRVISASGGLGGFAGGLDAKRWLLDHEQASQ